MAYRKPIENKNLDEKIFRKTAANTKAVNLGAKTMRGGTRF